MKVLLSVLAWKVFLVVALLLMVVVNLSIDPNIIYTYPENIELDYSPGIRASIFAFLAAATFINFLPKVKGGELVDVAAKILAAVAGLIACWFFMVSETKGNPGPYLLAVVVPVGAILITAVIQLASARAVVRAANWTKTLLARKG